MPLGWTRDAEVDAIKTNLKLLQGLIDQVRDLIERQAERLHQQQPRYAQAISDLRRSGRGALVSRVQESLNVNDQLAKELHEARVHIADLQKQLRHEKDEHSAARSHIADLHNEIESMKQAHQADREQMIKDMDAYSSALLERDDFKPTSDAILKSSFQALAQDVESLARLQWRNPGQDSQRLRRFFLQDCMWTILVENIFCSPFRVFGEKGSSLEQQWNSECGQDPLRDNGFYVWPPPEIETERWRYTTIEECHASLQRPVPSEFDPRADLKKGFKKSTTRLKNTLAGMLNEVVIMDDNSVRAIEKLINTAAVMWLQFTMQRCRVLVTLQHRPETSDIRQRMYSARQGSTILTLLPALQRQGNSKGRNLHISTVITGCEGETAHVDQGILVN